MTQTIYQILQTSDGQELLSEPFQQLSEQSQHLLKLAPTPIFPSHIFKQQTALSTLKSNFSHLLSTGEVLHHWQHSLPKADLIFTYFVAHDSTGCEHFPTNLSLTCTCGVTACCRYCHDEAENSCLNFTFHSSNCMLCKAQTDQKICECGKNIQNYLCKSCGISSLHPQFSHCEICGCLPFTSGTHCSLCDRCHPYKVHDCTPLQTDPCPICFANYDNLLFKPTTLTCGHVLHEQCIEKMARNGEIECPMDKLKVQTFVSSKAAWNKFVSIYAMCEVGMAQIGVYYWISCSQGCEDFVANWHPKGYICPRCLGVNCTQKALFEGENAPEIIQKQYDFIREKHNRTPIYPLILYPKQGNLEMDDMIQDYVARYKDFWLEHVEKLINPQGEVPLREFVLAFCLTRIFDENIGFAALNLMHARQIFPENVRDLDRISVEAIVEVRELRRLKID